MTRERTGDDPSLIDEVTRGEMWIVQQREPEVIPAANPGDRRTVWSFWTTVPASHSYEQEAHAHATKQYMQAQYPHREYRVVRVYTEIVSTFEVVSE